MLTKSWATWPLLLHFILSLLTLVNADVSHLAKEYLPPDVGKSGNAQPLADDPAAEDPMRANDGSFYQLGGLMLPSGYAIPTGGNVAPPMSPPNFPLPIYPPFFGFAGGPEGLAGGQPVQQGFPNGQQFPGASFPEGQFPGGPQGAPFPVGPQGGPFPAGPQGAPFPVGPQGAPFPVGPQGAPFPVGPQGAPFPVGPQGAPFPNGPEGAPFPGGPQGAPFPTGPQGSPFPTGPQGSPFPTGPQGSPFPTGPQGGPFPTGPQGGAFPVGPIPQGPPFPFQPDYLTTQGLPSPNMQLNFGMPPGFGGPQSNYPYQPFSPSFGIPGQNYQPQPFADEPEPKQAAKSVEVSAKPKSSQTITTTVAPKTQNRDTVYAANGGYVYQRAK